MQTTITNHLQMTHLVYNSENGQVSKLRKRIRRIGEMPQHLKAELAKIKQEPLFKIAK